MERRFAQVDVFTDVALKGNPLAVVLDSDGLSDEQMQTFANWTNLSETTFLRPPTDPAADYAVRIFTPMHELPFAGHPTLGSCRVWLDHGGVPKEAGTVVQECGAGLVSVRVDGDRQAFEAPPMVRTGDLDDELVDRIAAALRIARTDIVASQWIDNGPHWIGVLLGDADAVLALEPDGQAFDGLAIGVAGSHPDDAEHDLEVRAFFPTASGFGEDPVTGSLNASLAQWMLREGRISAPYVARQGTRLGRDGRVAITQDGAGSVWVGGDVVTCVRGNVEL